MSLIKAAIIREITQMGIIFFGNRMLTLLSVHSGRKDEHDMYENG